MADFSTVDLGIIALLLDEDDEVSSRRRRRFGVRKSLQKRKTEGEYWTLFEELVDDEERFFQYFRMSRYHFQVLLMKIEKSITKADTNFKQAIAPKEKLAVCLRFLSTGDSFRAIAINYRLGNTTVAKMVKEVCDAIVKNLSSQYMPIPRTAEGWTSIAKDFWKTWNFPNCVGAFGAKHVTPCSVVIMALVDAHCRFLAVDIGGYGIDGGVFSYSKLGEYLEKRKLNIPGKKKLPNSEAVAPHVMVGDEAFPLKYYLLRPYSGKQLDQDPQKGIFNERLNRAHRVVENAFGMLSHKFRLYNSRIQLKPENVESVLMTTCILHNFILEGQNSTAVEDSVTLGKNLQPLPHQRGNATHSAFHVRDVFKEYFCSEAGKVAAQWQHFNPFLDHNYQ